jgi:hypothetical protein
VYQNAQSCGAHLNSLRSSAQNRGWVRLITSLLGGATTTVTGYVAATKTTDDPSLAKTSAQIALIGGLVAVAAQAIPDPTEALDKHRAGASSWVEARRLAVSGGSEPQMFQALDDCRSNTPSKSTRSTEKGAPL